MSARQTLPQWVVDEKARVDRFAAWWMKNRRKQGSRDWPLCLPPGEWDEQYRMFDDPEVKP